MEESIYDLGSAIASWEDKNSPWTGKQSKTWDLCTMPPFLEHATSSLRVFGTPILKNLKILSYSTQQKLLKYNFNLYTCSIVTMLSFVLQII